MKFLVRLTTTDGLDETFFCPPPEGKDWRASDVWVCRECGNPYAWLKVDGSPYIATMGRCQSCTIPDNAFIAGSIWSSWDNALVSAFPPAVCLREIILHCNHIERLYNAHQ